MITIKNSNSKVEEICGNKLRNGKVYRLLYDSLGLARQGDIYFCTNSTAFSLSAPGTFRGIVADDRYVEVDLEITVKEK